MRSFLLSLVCEFHEGTTEQVLLTQLYVVFASALGGRNKVQIQLLLTTQMLGAGSES